jgi:kynurenine 3-monooxygenase
MQRLDQFNFSQQYIPDGYREILLPANADGSYKLDKETLHIWPRGRFMLIALPNADGSFTCTLFMPFDGHEYCFNALDSQSKVEDFFKEIFPDFYQLHPQVAEEWEKHPLSSLAIIRCFPWTQERTILMGDAAHATVPFFGQGMNCGFEDCTVLFELMQEYEENWALILPEYEKRRKPNTDAMQELSLQNYLVMRDRVTDTEYQLIQRLERRLSVMYPESYFPLYSMVSFTNIPYETALRKGNEQEAKIRKLIEENQLTMETSDAEIDQCLFSLADQIQMA